MTCMKKREEEGKDLFFRFNLFPAVLYTLFFDLCDGLYVYVSWIEQILLPFEKSFYFLLFLKFLDITLPLLLDGAASLHLLEGFPPLLPLLLHPLLSSFWERFFLSIVWGEQILHHFLQFLTSLEVLKGQALLLLKQGGEILFFSASSLSLLIVEGGSLSYRATFSFLTSLFWLVNGELSNLLSIVGGEGTLLHSFLLSPHPTIPHWLRGVIPHWLTGMEPLELFFGGVGLVTALGFVFYPLYEENKTFYRGMSETMLRIRAQQDVHCDIFMLAKVKGEVYRERLRMGKKSPTGNTEMQDFLCNIAEREMLKECGELKGELLHPIQILREVWGFEVSRIIKRGEVNPPSAEEAQAAIYKTIERSLSTLPEQTRKIFQGEGRNPFGVGEPFSAQGMAIWIEEQMITSRSSEGYEKTLLNQFRGVFDYQTSLFTWYREMWGWHQEAEEMLYQTDWEMGESYKEFERSLWERYKDYERALGESYRDQERTLHLIFKENERNLRETLLQETEEEREKLVKEVNEFHEGLVNKERLRSAQYDDERSTLLKKVDVERWKSLNAMRLATATFKKADLLDSRARSLRMMTIEKLKFWNTNAEIKLQNFRTRDQKLLRSHYKRGTIDEIEKQTVTLKALFQEEKKQMERERDEIVQLYIHRIMEVKKERDEALFRLRWIKDRGEVLFQLHSISGSSSTMEGVRNLSSNPSFDPPLASTFDGEGTPFPLGVPSLEKGLEGRAKEGLVEKGLGEGGNEEEGLVKLSPLLPPETVTPVEEGATTCLPLLEGQKEGVPLEGQREGVPLEPQFPLPLEGLGLLRQSQELRGEENILLSSLNSERSPLPCETISFHEGEVAPITYKFNAVYDGVPTRSCDLRNPSFNGISSTRNPFGFTPSMMKGGEWFIPKRGRPRGSKVVRGLTPAGVRGEFLATNLEWRNPFLLAEWERSIKPFTHIFRAPSLKEEGPETPFIHIFSTPSFKEEGPEGGGGASFKTNLFGRYAMHLREDLLTLLQITREEASSLTPTELLDYAYVRFQFLNVETLLEPPETLERREKATSLLSHILERGKSSLLELDPLGKETPPTFSKGKGETPPLQSGEPAQPCTTTFDPNHPLPPLGLDPQTPYPPFDLPSNPLSPKGVASPSKEEAGERVTSYPFPSLSRGKLEGRRNGVAPPSKEGGIEAGVRLKGVDPLYGSGFDTNVIGASHPFPTQSLPLTGELRGRWNLLSREKMKFILKKKESLSPNRAVTPPLLGGKKGVTPSSFDPLPPFGPNPLGAKGGGGFPPFPSGKYLPSYTKEWVNAAPKPLTSFQLPELITIRRGSNLEKDNIPVSNPFSYPLGTSNQIRAGEIPPPEKLIPITPIWGIREDASALLWAPPSPPKGEDVGEELPSFSSEGFRETIQRAAFARGAPSGVTPNPLGVQGVTPVMSSFHLTSNPFSRTPVVTSSEVRVRVASPSKEEVTSSLNPLPPLGLDPCDPLWGYRGYRNKGEELRGLGVRAKQREDGEPMGGAPHPGSPASEGFNETNEKYKNVKIDRNGFTSYFGHMEGLPEKLRRRDGVVPSPERRFPDECQYRIDNFSKALTKALTAWEQGVTGVMAKPEIEEIPPYEEAIEALKEARKSALKKDKYHWEWYYYLLDDSSMFQEERPLSMFETEKMIRRMEEKIKRMGGGLEKPETPPREVEKDPPGLPPYLPPSKVPREELPPEPPNPRGVFIPENPNPQQNLSSYAIPNPYADIPSFPPPHMESIDPHSLEGKSSRSSKIVDVDHFEIDF